MSELRVCPHCGYLKPLEAFTLTTGAVARRCGDCRYDDLVWVHEHHHRVKRKAWCACCQEELSIVKVAGRG